MEDKVTVIREFEMKTPSTLDESQFNTMILALKNIEVLIQPDDVHLFNPETLNWNLDVIIDAANKMKIKMD